MRSLSYSSRCAHGATMAGSQVLAAAGTQGTGQGRLGDQPPPDSSLQPEEAVLPVVSSGMSPTAQGGADS